MEAPIAVLDDIASAVSSNVSYATTHLHDLCIIEEPLAHRISTLRSDPSWLDDWFEKGAIGDRETFRSSCYLTIRNMLFRIVRHEEPMQWYYSKSRQRGIYDALWAIDQSAKILQESSVESLASFSAQCLNQFTDILEWVLEEYADTSLLPWSLFYTETDRTSPLQRAAHLMRFGLPNEKFLAFLLYRHDLLDHFTGNIPPDKQWENMLSDEGYRSLYNAATSHSIKRISKAVSLLHSKLPNKSAA